jgi:transcription initiation factor TFIID subunit 2
MGSSEFAPITVRIEYSMHNPPDGVQFIIPSDTHPYVSAS